MRSALASWHRVVDYRTSRAQVPFAPIKRVCGRGWVREREVRRLDGAVVAEFSPTACSKLRKSMACPRDHDQAASISHCRCGSVHGRVAPDGGLGCGRSRSASVGMPVAGRLAASGCTVVAAWIRGIQDRRTGDCCEYPPRSLCPRGADGRLGHGGGRGHGHLRVWDHR